MPASWTISLTFGTSVQPLRSITSDVARINARTSASYASCRAGRAARRSWRPPEITRKSMSNESAGDEDTADFHLHTTQNSVLRLTCTAEGDDNLSDSSPVVQARQ